MMLTRSSQLCRAQSNTHEIAAFVCVCVVEAILSLSPSCSHVVPENRTGENRPALGNLPKISWANRRQSKDLHPGHLVGFPLCPLGQVSDHSPVSALTDTPLPQEANGTHFHCSKSQSPSFVGPSQSTLADPARPRKPAPSLPTLCHRLSPLGAKRLALKARSLCGHLHRKKAGCGW